MCLPLIFRVKSEGGSVLYGSPLFYRNRLLPVIVSMVIRSFAVPIGIGLVGGIGGLLAANKGLGLWYPYSLYSLGMRAEEGGYDGQHKESQPDGALP